MTFSCAPSQSGRDAEVADGTFNSRMQLWPNPNRGDELNVTIDDLGALVGTATIDIIDLFGKRVATGTINVDGSNINHVLKLRADIADGLYIVNITAGDKTFTQRLVIAR